MKNKWWLGVLAVVALLLAGAGGYYYYTRQVAQTAAAQETPLQTAVARQGDLVIMASGSGSIVPASQVGLGFDEAGTILAVNVKAGDTIKKGDVLARLQTKNSPETIAADIADAELAVLKAQSSLDDLYTNAEIARTTAMNNVTTYAQAVRDAQYNLDNYTVPTQLQGMTAIQSLDWARQRLDAARQAFEPYKYLSSSNETRTARLETLNNAQSDYDAAVKRLNLEYLLDVAQANLQKARQEYESYSNGPAEKDVTLAKAELDNAKARLALAKETKPELELTAPADGTIMDVTASVGEAVSATPIITLADLSQTWLETYLDETDLDKVSVGSTTDVSFDALPDQTFTGQVKQVFPSLQTVSGVATIKIMVLLEPGKDGKPLSLPVGTNAAVDVIAGRARNAVLVPVEALHELDPGEYAVFVVQNGELKLRPVQVGLKDLTSAEITSGLQAGETVSTGNVATK